MKEDGSLGLRNGVSTNSIESKMGIRGSATCVLNFDDAVGYMIGPKNKGLSSMFTMMNLERIVVGIQGLGISEVAYQNSLNYAQERKQGKKDVKCADVNKSGNRCGITAEPGSSYCTIHTRVKTRSGGKKRQCKGTRTNGQRCKIQTAAKSGYCYYHD